MVDGDSHLSIVSSILFSLVLVFVEPSVQEYVVEVGEGNEFPALVLDSDDYIRSLVLNVIVILGRMKSMLSEYFVELFCFVIL